MTSDLQMHRSSRLLSSGSGVSQMSQRTFVVVLKRVVHNKRKSPGTSGEVPLHLVGKKSTEKSVSRLVGFRAAGWSCWGSVWSRFPATAATATATAMEHASLPRPAPPPPLPLLLLPHFPWSHLSLMALHPLYPSPNSVQRGRSICHMWHSYAARKRRQKKKEEQISKIVVRQINIPSHKKKLFPHNSSSLVCLPCTIYKPTVEHDQKFQQFAIRRSTNESTKE